VLRTRSEEKSQPLLVGVARAVITPPVGVRLIGSLRDGASRRVERDLTATALVLAVEDVKVVLLACDLTLFTFSEASSLRERIGEAVGTSAECVLLNTSHTHAAPSSPGFQEHDPIIDAEEVAVAQRYFAAMVDQCIGIAAAANRCATPARYGVATGAVRIGVNRRERLPDGTMVLGEDPNGIVDPAVNVVRFDTFQGSPIATLVNYACHPDVLGPKCDLISPDYVGPARATVETITGAPMLFFQGASADIDPRCGIVLGDDALDEMNRLGTELGCEVARIFQTINTARRRDRRVAWESTASVVTGWAYTDVEDSSHHLSATTRTLSLPLRPLPDLETAERAVRDADDAYRRTVAATSQLSDRLVASRRMRWARLQRDSVLEGLLPALPFELQAIRLDDLAIVAMPGELFVEIGLAIKECSPAVNTFVMPYSNGLYFYIPTSEAFTYGGYEVESYKNFLQPSGPTPEWGEILIRESADLLHSLFGADVLV
jgi:neutral ceramidase